MKKFVIVIYYIIASCVGNLYADESSSSSAAQLPTFAIKATIDANHPEYAGEIIQGMFIINSDGTSLLLKNFSFGSCCGFYVDQSYVDEKTGNILFKSTSGYWVEFDTSSYEINMQHSKWDNGFTKTFEGVFGIDDIIEATYDSNGNPITKIKSSEIVSSDGDAMISVESDGSVHIGENSLVTIEESGVQQLYATNASNEQININIKKGTDILIDGVSVAGSLNANATNIATNKTDIATNETKIVTNTTNIATNKTNIATNATNIAANTAEIATYTDSIAGNTTAIAAIGSDLDAYKASANSQMNYMKSDYSSGIASAVAMSQFNLAQDGFSIGVGRGSYNDEDETAFGLGYGGEFKNGTLFKLQASKSGDASGVGLTISF